MVQMSFIERLSFIQSLVVVVLQSTTSGDSGDGKTARTHGTISLICTAAGWFTAIAGIAIIVGAIIGAVNAQNNSFDNNRNF